MKWNNFDAGYEIAQHALALTPRPTAFFVYSDLAALGFQKALLDSGLSIPDDIALIGFDNIERSAYAPVPLTTIHQSTFEIGNMAFANLARIIEGYTEAHRPQLLRRSPLIYRAKG
jgi:DNA-binding LacI/PurR family transcriptional regulator